MKYSLYLLVLLSFFSCAVNRVIINSDGQAYTDLMDTGKVISGLPNLYIETVTDSREMKANIGLAKTGTLGDFSPIETSRPFSEEVKYVLEKQFLKKGFLISAASKNVLKLDISKFELKESPPRTVPERSYCYLGATVNFYSVDEQRDVLISKVNIELSSPESFDATKYLDKTFVTCLAQLVSKLAIDPKVQEVLRFSYK
ncbi:putative lipoprotein [Bacteriovorax sp. Seq25_V]|uniref:putative lipoprotein n=1 Tax=Bacteriovorax sp. Seq25_V TaxID=1201288 RepID=UPI00038A1019|nr:putative lipoprotein [Bacteriovorax sp. Seq25_V]EQC47721.1 putative lipoprotein [Bacteriovorax sp. Seq25_V]